MAAETATIQDIVYIVRLCARLVLENGGETYRAEETVVRICQAFGYSQTEVIAIPTGVFITISKDGTNLSSSVNRIRKRSFNMQAIDSVNNIARSLTAHTLSAADAIVQLRALCCEKPQKKLVGILAAGLSSGFFALLFGGSAFDFFAAALCGVIVQITAGFIKTKDLFNFTVSLLGGFLIGLGSVLCVTAAGQGHLDKIITGAMMPLLPGVPMTNAIRDTMRGDLLSGVARGAEALLIAASLAFGVGLVLKLYFQLI